MDPGPPVIRLAVFGNPVAQSLSPRIHRMFGSQCGLEVDYRAIEATAETFPRRVSDLASRGGRGCNVTVPLKREALKLARRCSEGARLARSVNTLVFSGPDDWYGDSTDGRGLVNDLKASGACALRGARICLLGAGGAAGGVLGDLLAEGPSAVIIANRTVQRAADLANAHAGLGDVMACAPEDIDGLGPFDLVLNATSLGHHGRAPGVSAAWLQPGALCYDMNYGAAAEPLQRLCQERDIRYRDGLGMLVGQAALSFELWTGKRPTADEVLEDLRRQLPANR